MGLLGGLFGKRKSRPGADRAGDAAGDEPVSLVVLRHERLDFDPAAVMAAMEAAGGPGEVRVLPPEQVEGPMPGRTAVRLPFAVGGVEFLGLLCDFPYMADPEAASRDVPREDLRRALAEHQSWLSVDAIGPAGPGAYDVIGRVAAGMIDAACTALYMPARGRFSFPTPTLTDALRRGDWIAVFDEVGTDAVAMRSPGDADLEAAAEEARRRIPEFVLAFERGDGRSFSVKRAFREGGEVEHMWVAVAAMDEDGFVGPLNSEPRIVAGLRCGQDVRVRLDEVEDWMFERDGLYAGGFQVRVLSPELASRFEGGGV